MSDNQRDVFAWERAQESARVIVPLVTRYVEPQSVVDVGCGIGAWLSVFSEQGITEVQGIDHNWVDRTRLLIPQGRFMSKDLERPFTLDRQYDLAVSLETAEHLNASAADGFVESLTKLAPVVLFSAAIPYQAGVHHVNEQWPEYWEIKFKKYGFVPVDCIRRRVWRDSRVSFWYKQNVLIYVKEDELKTYPALAAEIEAGYDEALALIHPEKYLYFAERWQSMVPLLGWVPRSVLRCGKWVVAKFRRSRKLD